MLSRAFICNYTLSVAYDHYHDDVTGGRCISIIIFYLSNKQLVIVEASRHSRAREEPRMLEQFKNRRKGNAKFARLEIVSRGERIVEVKYLAPVDYANNVVV